MKLVGYESNHRVEAVVEQGKVLKEAIISRRLKPVLDTLLLDKPLWEFRVTNFDGFEHEGSVLMILKDGEELGHVSYGRVGYANSNGKYKVHNHRINAKMERRSFYSTESVDKAVAKIKKEFTAKTMGELLSDAEQRAGQAMYDLRSGKHGEYSRYRQVIDKALIEYANTIGWEPFKAHMQATDVTTFNTIGKRDELYQEFLQMDAIEKQYQQDTALFVLRCGTIYTVKQGLTNIVRYTDADLPESLKRKLGMLKLIDPKHYISGVGFRADENTFVVMSDGEKKDE